MAFYYMAIFKLICLILLNCAVSYLICPVLYEYFGNLDANTAKSIISVVLYLFGSSNCGFVVVVVVVSADTFADVKYPPPPKNYSFFIPHTIKDALAECH